MKKFDLSLLFVAGCSLFIFISRLLPHEPNLTPVLALCLMSGFLAKGKPFGLIMPLLALAISDWWIGFYPGWGLNYLSMVLVVLSASLMKGQLASFLGFGVLAAVNFFLASNFAVWLYTAMYPKTFEGLAQCFYMAEPFFRSTLTGTLIFMVGFYFVYKIFSPSTQLSGETERV